MVSPAFFKQLPWSSSRNASEVYTSRNSFRNGSSVPTGVAPEFLQESLWSFSRILFRVPPEILPEISSEFFREFLWSFTGISSRLPTEISAELLQKFLWCSLANLLDFILHFLRTSSGASPRIPFGFLHSSFWNISVVLPGISLAFLQDFPHEFLRSSSSNLSVISLEFLQKFLNPRSVTCVYWVHVPWKTLERFPP